MQTVLFKNAVVVIENVLPITASFPSRHINSYVESVLPNIWVPPLTSPVLVIVFTGSEFFDENAVFLLNEIELSKMNAKFVFFVVFYMDKKKLEFYLYVAHIHHRTNVSTSGIGLSIEALIHGR